MSVPKLTNAWLLLLVLFMSALAQVPADEWTFPPGLVRDNGVRGQVFLNAAWRGRWPEKTEVQRVNVPGFQKSNKGIEYSREFDLPSGWEKRRIFLKVTAPESDLAVTLNGVPAGVIAQREWFTPLELKNIRAGRNTIAIVTPMLRENVELLSLPSSETSIDNSFIQTSVRQQRVSIDLEGRSAPKASLSTVVRIFADEQATREVKRLEAGAKISADDAGAWKATLAAPWTDAKLWSHWEPNLYWYTVEVRDASGQLVDHVLPRPFGFREVVRDGRKVYLNGNEIHFFSDIWMSMANTSSFSRETGARAVSAVKSMGIYSAMRNGSIFALSVWDHEGIFTSQWLGGLSWPLEAFEAIKPGEAGDEGGEEDIRRMGGVKLEDSQRIMRGLIREFREHPSILFWTFASPWQRGTLNSSIAGRIDDPWNYWPGTNEIEKNKKRYAAAIKTLEFIKQADPTRLVGTQNLPQADIETATRYLCDNLDLQEREEFFRNYEESDSQTVMWSSEHGMPFQGHQFLRKSAFQLPQGNAWPAIHVENAARLFGEDAYLGESDERLASFFKFQDYDHRRSPVFQRLAAENLGMVTRAWRATPASFNAHWVLRDGFDLKVNFKNPPTAQERWGAPPDADPRRDGRAAHGSLQTLPLPGIDTVLPAGTAYLKSLSPLMAYIAGAPSVYNKDHLYFSGQTIEKTVVILNDLGQSATIEGQWKLTDSSGQEQARGPLNAVVAPGQRSRGPVQIRFAAPAVSERTDYTLSIQVSSNLKGQLADTFALTVFPRSDIAQPKKPSARYLVLTNGGAGTEAVTLLKSAGVAAISVSKPADLRWQPGDVLVLPRRYLPDAPPPTVIPPGQKAQAAALVADKSVDPNLAFLRAIDFDGQVRKGLRVLVLEQDAKVIFGLRTETVRPRRTFVSAAGHPAFSGLSQSDFSYWTGDSDLRTGLEPVSNPNVFPSRIWGVSNTNAVASRTILRPQRGASRALLVSGFDLQETPLLEVTRGQGRIIFCQLDVSNRYTKCPAATALLDNLLAYLAKAPAPDPTHGDVVDVAAGSSGVQVRPQTYRAEKPSGSDAWGITRAELFFRESLYAKNALTRSRPSGEIPVFSGTESQPLPRVIQLRKDGRFETTLTESAFATGWSRQKVAILHAALRANQGTTSAEGPGVDKQDDPESLYPNKWIEGFVHPYTAACW